MPKMKTKSSAKKRFRLTGSGKLVRNHAFKRHILSNRPQSMKRKARGTTLVHKSDVKLIKTYMPYHR